MAHVELPDDPSHLAARRAALRTRLGGATAFFFAGRSRPRNYPANVYPFRAGSHFLYFGGAPVEGAVLVVGPEETVLLREPPTAEDALWHGTSPSDDELRCRLGLTRVVPLSELAGSVARAREPRTLPAVDLGTRLWQAQVLGRGWPVDRPLGPCDLDPPDRALAEAVVELRLRHDEAALSGIRAACRVTAAAHGAGAAAAVPGARVASVRAAVEGVMASEGAEPAYGSIVTVEGEVLHHTAYHGTLREGDLLLVDAGAELCGWASDVTRTYPVGGRFLPEQRAIYDIVAAAQQAAIDRVRPGVRYRDLHLAAARVIADGLVQEGVLRGDVDGLVEAGAHALFFPHGLGHLLGMDVHDMEDLGDLAGYAPGRRRSEQFGLTYLRLDRDLEADMVVTIEPGIYFVPAILESEDLGRSFARRHMLRPEGLARFRRVRGVRIEDDVRVTDGGAEVLTAEIPKDPKAVEDAMGRGFSGPPPRSGTGAVGAR